MAQQVAPVRGHLHVEAMVVQIRRLRKGRARLVRALHEHDPGVVVAQPQLAFGAQHAPAFLPPDPASADLEAPREHRAHRRERVERARAHVRRAADHGRLAVRTQHPAQDEAVGVGVGAHVEHLADHDVAEARGQVLDPLHRRTAQG